MMNWRHTLLAGGAIILLTNAVALGGAGYNRSGEAESQLQLTQRELTRSYSYSRKDNSGITLRLSWRFEQLDRDDDSDFGMYSGDWGVPTWLDKAKMSELGFDVEKLESKTEYGRRHQEDQSREVLLVLELDGEAYRHHLQRVREYVAESRKLLAASPGNEDMQRRAKNAEDNFKQEQEQGSRLFVIDAGLSLDALRAAYPDRGRFAIVHGLVRPDINRIDNKIRVGGNIGELHGGQINVPLAHRQAVADPASFDVTVAFGKRLEPWIVAATKGARAKQTEEES